MMMVAMTVAPETLRSVAITMWKLKLMTNKTFLTVSTMNTPCSLVMDMAMEIYFCQTGVPG